MPSYSAIIESDAIEDISVTNTAGGLTLPAYFSQTGKTGGRARIQVRTADILYTIHGTAPTAADEATGHKLSVGQILILTTLAEMNNLSMVRATGTNGSVNVQYDKRIG